MYLLFRHQLGSRCSFAGLLALWCLFTDCAANSLDLRVSKAMGSRGYNMVRISVVDDGSGNFGDFFDYNNAFVHTWTNLHLHTAVKDVINGSVKFNIGGHEVSVTLPKEGNRSRGLFLADPCISSRDLFCPNKDRFKIAERLPAIINTLFESEEIDFWGIIGDNFYEARSPIARDFFDALSLKVKQKPFLSVPGNHDFWIVGGPPGVASDQFGNGFMQYYGQDTEAGLRGPTPYDFSVNPGQVAALDNFVFSHQIGDIAFFGFSGAHKASQLQPYQDRFCNWLANASTVHTAIILGHWNQDNLGCTSGMSAPDVYEALKNHPGCRQKLIMYIDGHDHCNRVTEPEHGFMIGANGMGGCGQFGFLVVESDPNAYSGPNARVDYFEIANMESDNYDELQACLKRSGYIDCRDSHAAQWRAYPVPPTLPPTTSTHAPNSGDPSGWKHALLWIAGVVVVALLGVALGLVLVRKRRNQRQIQVASLLPERGTH